MMEVRKLLGTGGLSPGGNAQSFNISKKRWDG